MRKPNFFIIGAPKCGTSSLSEWLREHENIFMSPIKEPHFFDTDHTRVITDIRDYEALFEQAGEQHLAVGEASVRYLHSTDAVKNILEYSPDAKFIVMLRNPVAMATSLHQQLYRTLQENHADFLEAWERQDERREGKDIPKGVIEPSQLQYAEYCALGAQVERLLAAVPQDRCMFIFLDDLKRDTRKVYTDVLEFIGVPDDGRTEFPVENAANEHASRTLAFLIEGASALRERLLPARVTGSLTGRFNFFGRLKKLNSKARKREPLAPPQKKMLVNYFREDIEKLERLLETDLHHWTKV